MSDVHDAQTEAEVLDGDVIDPLNYPPDEPLGVMDLLNEDVPVAGAYAPDDLEERIAREEPDFGEGPVVVDDSIAGVIDPDDPFGDDLTKELIGEEAERGDDLDDPMLSDSEASPVSSTLPAEEAAMHLVREEDAV
jgi:hypothetical protein